MSVDNKIPNGWREENLVSHLETVIDYRGKTPKKSPSGILTLSAKSVKMGHIDYSQAYYISKETYDAFMVRGFPKVGDILMTTEAPLGCIAKLDKDDVGIAQRLITLRGKENILHNDYLMYYLMSRRGQYELQSRASGSTVQGIKRTEFEKVDILLPEFEEQVAITKILTAFDDKIELLQAQNKTLETTAQTIFKEWFGKYQIGDELPDGWRVGKITELFEVRDGTHDSPKEKSSGLKLITSRHLGNNRLLFEDAYFISEEDYNQINKRSQVEQFDILFSMIGTIGLAYFEQNEKINYAIKNVALFKCSQNIQWANYTFLWLTSFLGAHFITTNKSGSTQEYVSLSSLRNIDFIIPKDEKLIEFNNFIKPIFNKIFNNSTQIQTIKQTRDTLLPKLMSGALRVDEFKENAV